MNKPLAERMRPTQLGNYFGQKHLVGKGAVLSTLIEKKMLPSIILWGPPGVGKTTLANIIANELKRPFYSLSAINSGVKEVRDVIEKSEKNAFFGVNNPILFIDEIHRFSKSQQDSLLGAVEKGIITLIGATTENPSFEVIPALLSRCQVYILKPLKEDELKDLINFAIVEDKILSQKNIEKIEYEALIKLSGGDARKILNVLELVFGTLSLEEKKLTNELVYEKINENIPLYDKTGEQHYDIISAFIKSIRASDPNAGVYWLARMIEGGEDPVFIARRLLILASEDIGNANPTALVIANNCLQAVNSIGWPESRIILSQTTTYLACSPKSNASYLAINKAQTLVKQTGNLTVPYHLRNAPTKLMQDLDYGKGYKYDHDFQNQFSEQECMPKEISGTKLYEPAENQREKEIRNYLKALWKKKYNY
jgi:putative ATPase